MGVMRPLGWPVGAGKDVAIVLRREEVVLSATEEAVDAAGVGREARAERRGGMALDAWGRDGGSSSDLGTK